MPSACRQPSMSRHQNWSAAVSTKPTVHCLSHAAAWASAYLRVVQFTGAWASAGIAVVGFNGILSVRPSGLGTSRTTTHWGTK